MTFSFYHFNFNVLELERSLRFYSEARGLFPVREINPEDGSFRLVFLGDGKTDFQLELTWLRGRTSPYDLGEDEFHLAMRVDDYAAARKKHDEMGVVCFENPKMGIYSIADPDNYWIEILPDKR
jgi:lactoylglutathione lyase